MSFVPGDHEYGRWAVAAKWKHCDEVATQCGPYQRSASQGLTETQVLSIIAPTKYSQ